MENTTQEQLVYPTVSPSSLEEKLPLTEAMRRIDVSLGVKCNNVPTKIIKRNKYGLIEDLNYSFEESGLVNWRGMIKPEFLVVNKQNFERRKKEVPNSIEGLPDKDILILLPGIKNLAAIRGFTSVNYILTSPSENYVASVCTIKWICNYESEDKEIIFSGCGDAHPRNTNFMGKNYLTAFAENRSFIRCVRNFLRINILGQEELGAEIEESSKTDEVDNVLQKIMNEHGISFEKVKNRLIEDKYFNKELNLKAEDITSIIQVDRIQQFRLIEKIKSRLNK